MAWIESDRELQIAVGVGVPPIGKIVKGGIAISLDSNGNFLNLYTSNNGENIIRFTTVAVDSEKLQGKTVSQIQAAVVSAITNGASGAYNTLKELETELKKNDSDISTILAGMANKVSKVSGKSLISNTLVTKIANLPIFRQDSYNNSIVQRHGQDIKARLFRSEYTSTNSNANYFVTMVQTGKDRDNYMRPSTVAQVRAKLGVEQGSQQNSKIMEF